MSYTVWSYDYDAAPHHKNDLLADTVDSFKEAEALARKRAGETNHNTGYSKVVDNIMAGRGGDSGVVAIFAKTSAGIVRRNYMREPYRKLLRPYKITGEGLRATFNRELKLWEYFQSSGPHELDLRQTGSTIEFQP